MPSNWLYVDTQFPTFTGEESVNEKVTTIQNYMFMLVEQLRYTLHNLDLRNMNQAAVSQFTGNITEPVYARIEDAEGSITQLSLTAQGLQSQVSNVDGRVTYLSQTIDGFTLYAEDNGQSSYLALSSRGFVLTSTNITFSGMVTFTALSTAGMTTINGGNIRTGVITAITVNGCTITGGTVTGSTIRSVSSSDNGFELYRGVVTSSTHVGGIRFDENGQGTPEEAQNRMFIYTLNPWAMKLLAAGSMSIESGGMIYMSARANIRLDTPSLVSLTCSALFINGTSLEQIIRNIVSGMLPPPSGGGEGI